MRRTKSSSVCPGGGKLLGKVVHHPQTFARDARLSAWRDPVLNREALTQQSHRGPVIKTVTTPQLLSGKSGREKKLVSSVRTSEPEMRGGGENEEEDLSRFMRLWHSEILILCLHLCQPEERRTPWRNLRYLHSFHSFNRITLELLWQHAFLCVCVSVRQIHKSHQGVIRARMSQEMAFLRENEI